MRQRMDELRDKLRLATDGPTPAPVEDGRAQASASARTGPSTRGGGGQRDDAARREPMHCDAGNFGSKDFSVWESHVATKFGLARRELVMLRWKHLTDGAHYIKTGRRIVYSPAGVEKLAGVLRNGAEQTKSLPTNAVSEIPPSEELIETFTVRRKAHNSRVLECLTDDARIVVVRVRDNRNFLPGMEVTAIPYGDLKNVFEFVGAYPRYRGKY